MPFGVWTQVGLRNHVLDGVHLDAIWRSDGSIFAAAAMRSMLPLLQQLDRYTCVESQER